MPLEDLTGNKYIDDLNENWPLGTDYPSDGDNHITGIKNVLKKSFPNITGPVTLTQDQINQGSIPSGTVMMFYQPSAPEGWTRVQNLTTDHMIRIVETTDETSGGTAAGTDNPILNDKTSDHTHPVSGTSGNQNRSHTHSGTTGSNLGNHSHTITNIVSGSGSGLGFGTGRVLGTRTTNSVNLAHSHSFSTGSNSASHQHSFSATSGNPNGGTVGNWVPRYMNAILCSRD